MCRLGIFYMKLGLNNHFFTLIGVKLMSHSQHFCSKSGEGKKNKLQHFNELKISTFVCVCVEHLL